MIVLKNMFFFEQHENNTSCIQIPFKAVLGEAKKQKNKCNTAQFRHIT